ncbi:MAG: NADPH:quinone oxidoreductase family protein [Rhodospirillales bacterium]|jgi:NADPH2:quinone reductase|nr:NADPH:quinone oxidoreductase family protein [Rhodospirillales bacterium]
MRAVVVHAFGPLDGHTVEDFPDPEPGPDDVLIDVHAAGVNFSDTLIVQGLYQLRPDPPFVPGRDAAGVVAEVGANVTRFRPGDRVMALVPVGAYGERLAAPQSRCFVMPDGMDFATGAAMYNAYAIAYVATVMRGRIEPGEAVLVTGASGGVGLACLEIAKAKGATVIAAVRTPDKGALANAHGADHWIDVSGPDTGNTLRDRTAEIAGPGGVDLVLDPVGGDVFDAALRTLGHGGRLISIGFAGGRVPEAKANYLLLKNIGVMGAYLDPHFAAEPERMDAAMGEILAMYERGEIRPEVTASYALEDFATALARFADHDVQGKLVLTTR